MACEQGQYNPNDANVSGAAGGGECRHLWSQAPLCLLFFVSAHHFVLALWWLLCITLGCVCDLSHHAHACYALLCYLHPRARRVCARAYQATCRTRACVVLTRACAVLALAPYGLCFLGPLCSSFIWISSGTIKRSRQRPRGNLRLRNARSANRIASRVLQLLRMCTLRRAQRGVLRSKVPRLRPR